MHPHQRYLNSRMPVLSEPREPKISFGKRRIE